MVRVKSLPLLLASAGLLVACGVDGPVLSYRDATADASVIPDGEVDAAWPPCQWEDEVVDPVRLGSPTSLALDTAGEPHVAYYAVTGPRDTQGWLRHAYRVAGQWHTTDVEGAPGVYGWVGLHPSLALDGQDRPRIAYRDASHDELKLASWDGSAWQLQLVETRGARPGLALDALDHAHIGYARYDPTTGRSALKLASWSGVAWQIQLLVGDGDVQYVSVALDGAGRAHLAYHDALWSRLHLGYAHWDGLTWHTEVVDDDSPGAIGAGCRIALDGLGRPHISYLDVAQQRLKHAFLEGAAWRVSVVEDAGWPGITTGLGIDGQDRPIVAYHRAQLAQLGLALFDSTAWLLQLVDGGLSGGKYVDLALDPADGIHLSYAGSGGGGEVLHYASCVAP